MINVEEAIIRVRGFRTDYDIPGRDGGGSGRGRRILGATICWSEEINNDEKSSKCKNSCFLIADFDDIFFDNMFFNARIIMVSIELRSVFKQCGFLDF